jgi:hypothetical protein
VRFLFIVENCREKSRSIALASVALLQRVLGAYSCGQVLHFQLATSIPHDFSDLANEFMASYKQKKSKNTKNIFKKWKQMTQGKRNIVK